jgi:predicted signal transduction protein with EAL and GGDEF domain
MKIRQLFLLLSAAFMLFPALTIGVWTYRQSVVDEFDDVKERHLLLAKNLSDTLGRYALNTKLIFEDVVENLSNGIANETSKEILKKLDFIEIAIVELNSGNILNCLSSNKSLEADRSPSPPTANRIVLNTARKWAIEGKTTFSPVISTGTNEYFILLIRKFGNKIAIGKLKTDYFNSLGDSISFGKKGHAIIVDNLGNVLSHPRKQWVKKQKNLAKIGPVAKMLDRKTGIQSFHAPVLNAEVIAGYSYVDSTGWGVMVLQPVSELYAKSMSTWKSYLITVSISFVLAMTLATWVSMRSTKPLLKLIAANRVFDNPGEQKLLVLPKNWGVPTEIKQLYQTHNEMVTKLRADHWDTLRMAYSDIITGLPSREAFNKIVEYEFGKAQVESESYLLVFLDFDDFKVVNDTMGHETGDLVLAKVSQQIAIAIGVQTGLQIITGPLDEKGNPIQKLNGRAILSRIGGDEFVALIPWNRNDGRIEAFLRAFSYSISTPFMIGDKELVTSASIGAALYRRDGINIRDLTKKADIAMYYAKKAGKGNFCLYDKTIGEQTPAEIQHEVAAAIRNNEMVLYYQPKINLTNGEANSVEAVTRWMHPQKGLIPPNQFIPVINNTIIADLLGEWVIRQACNQIRIWQKSGNNITVSVNIANHHLVSQNFMPNLLRIVDEIGVSPKHLEIEMTEETAMTAHKRAKHVIHALKESGFTVSLDDYGKGYSNLARLADLEIDVIKLDQSLISGITEDPRKAIIVASALDMARNLNCKTVAEGIETQEQASFISRMGCDYLQGFLYAKPMPVQELEGWLIEYTQKAAASPADEQSDTWMRAAS